MLVKNRPSLSRERIVQSLLEMYESQVTKIIKELDLKMKKKILIGN